MRRNLRATRSSLSMKSRVQTMRVCAFCFLVSLGFIPDGAAQRLAAYFDYKNSFQVFDDGVYKELEYTPVRSFKVGADFVAYINTDSCLKFYYKGNTYTLEESRPQNFQCSENFCIYKMNRRLMKVENGDKTTLCDWAEDYKIGDSIAAFVDYGDPAFRIYYNGETKALETGVNQGGVREYKVASNLVAYVDAGNGLKVFWHGKTYDMNVKNFSLSYEVATDMVCFVDNFNNEFKMFYQGEIITLDQTPPKEFKSNLNSIAFIDAGGNFNIFYKGETMFVASYAPDGYFPIGNMILFSYKNEFKAFFKGKTYLLEKNTVLNNPAIGTVNWRPGVYRDIYAYLDNMGRLKVFDNGELRANVCYELPTKIQVLNNMIVYNTGVSTVNIYYKGKVY